MPEKSNDLYIGVKTDLTPYYIDLKALTRSLVVIGQSGCGKSFMLGRLIEEIIRQTTDNSRILIFDPNSDFYHGLQLKPLADGDNNFNSVLRKYKTGILEKEYLEFEKYELDYYNTLKGLEHFSNYLIFGINEEFNLSWRFIAENIELYDKIMTGNTSLPEDRFAFTNCNFIAGKSGKVNLSEWFDIAASYLMVSDKPYERREVFGFKITDGIHITTDTKAIRKLADMLRSERHAGIWRKEEKMEGLPERLFSNGSKVNIFNFEKNHQNRSKLITISYILEYCLLHQKMLVASFRAAENSNIKAESKNVSAKLRHTFIVIDEAQEFAPDNTNDPLEIMLGDLIHTIAAEGRKYGLHIILATQRPNKVKKGLLGECDNAIIMKMNSRSDLEHLAKEMRILDVKLLEPCLHFQGQGNAIAVGEMTRMAPYVQLFKAAPRRTREGGVDIPDF
jgi:hypothetical protein